MAQIPIVDKNDKVIGFKERSEVKISEIVRTSALWIENNRGEVLLAQRAFHLKAYPGIWGTAVTGTVDKGETYESNMVKEAEEEIGLIDFKYETGPKFYIEEPTRHKFCQYFIGKLEKEIKDFKLSEEVVKIEWSPKERLYQLMEDDKEKYTPSLVEMIKYLES